MHVGLDGLSWPPEFRVQCLGLAYTFWPPFVHCGSNDRSIFGDFTLLFGLLGLGSTASVPTVPCCCSLRREKGFPQFWPPGMSCWRMSLACREEEISLAGCTLCQDDSCRRLSGPQTACCVVMWSTYRCPHLNPSPSASLVFLNQVKKSGPGPGRKESTYCYWNSRTVSLVGSARSNRHFRYGSHSVQERNEPT